MALIPVVIFGLLLLIAQALTQSRSLAARNLRCESEVRIRACAEFIKIQALALALGRDALRDRSIQQPVQTVGQRQHEAEQRGDTRPAAPATGPETRR